MPEKELEEYDTDFDKFLFGLMFLISLFGGMGIYALFV